MPRFKLTIEYDGTNYSGWQRQDGHPTVQAAIEKAIFSLTSQTVSIITAGRTDAGVHAIGQIAHVDLDKAWAVDTVRDALNSYLLDGGETIVILQAEMVDESFNARFSAIQRHYLYKIINRRAPAILDVKRVWWVPKPLDHMAMHEAAKSLLGKHDFTTFRASQCQANSPVRTLHKLSVEREGDIVKISASAPSFLHNQIRSFAGSLMQVGTGKWSGDDLVAALHAKDRTRCGVVAPPWGLYLTKVDYKDSCD